MAQIASLLTQKGLSLGTVESCTGGNIAQQITELAGASAYFKGSIIPYDTSLKSSLLEVDPKEIERHSTVSLEIAEALATGGRKKLGADYVVATTGIAGPTKGDGVGQVGRVCIAIASPYGVLKEEFMLGKARERIIQKAVDKALELLLKEISKN
ncbi:MAG: CinA family protein, partial [Bacteroidetes bacterium]|nr:CinA family protein [Bacteroidota bacterium]